MSFEADFKAHLNGDGTVAGLIGDRMHPSVRPEGGALPALVYQVTTRDQLQTHGGRADTLRNVRVQIDIWSSTYSALLALDAAVRARMETAANSFKSAMLPSGFDDYETDTKLYRRMLEFSCWYTET